VLPLDAEIFDVDLFHTPKEAITELHVQGKKVICYFSAGGSEDWRPDDKSFQAWDRGDPMKEWAGERWLNIRNANVFEVIKKRIQLAKDKGCDGIDPDNVDAFNHNSGRGGGFFPKLTKQDTIKYFKKLAVEAHNLDMAIGLKNTEELLPELMDVIQFTVNEECASTNDSEGCYAYTDLVSSGKPVFHIEYATPLGWGSNVTLFSIKPELFLKSSAQIESLFCLKTQLMNKKTVQQDLRDKFSTVIKVLGLDGWVMYCDRSNVRSETKLNDGKSKLQPRDARRRLPQYV